MSPEVNWDEELRNFWQGRAEVALGMLPLTLLGVGHSTVHEIDGARRIMADNEQLGRAGVPWEDRVKVTELEKSGRSEEAGAALCEAWPRRSVEEAAAFHRQWEQQQQAGGGRAPERGTPLRARTDKPGSWAEVQPGHSWASSKKFLPKLSDKRPGFGVKRGSWESIVSKVAQWLGVMPKVSDPWGAQVTFANPQQRGRFADPLENRAAHLVGKEEIKGTEDRTLHTDKLAWIGAVRKTIEDAQVRVRAGAETLYFRSYPEGVHMVVVEDGAV